MALIDPDLDLLRALVAVAETQNFTRAGDRIGRTQSAVSLQVKRLEEALGATLFDRSPHRVRLTAAGEAALDYARRILGLKDELVARLREGDIAGTVRIGAPEDFATRLMPAILAEFIRSHPNVTLQTTCALTLTLLDRFHAGEFDLVLVKRTAAAGQAEGRGVWREPLVWAAGPGGDPLARSPLPLAVAPEPCVMRRRAIEALDGAGVSWRLSYVCESQSGLRAAVAAGLGVTVLPRGAAQGLRILDGDALPRLEDTELALLAAEPLSAPAALLANHIGEALARGL